MTIQRFDTGPRMSKAVVNGNTVYLAGIVAEAPKGKSMAEQTKSVLSQIDGFLAQAGTDKRKLLSANIWITDLAKFGEMNAEWDAWVSPGNTPARATVEAKLASPDYVVAVMVGAARGARSRAYSRSSTIAVGGARRNSKPGSRASISSSGSPCRVFCSAAATGRLPARRAISISIWARRPKS